MPTRTMQVFLSYSAAERELAEGLARYLEREGFDVWYADARLFPGDNWSLAIGKALEDSDAMVVLLSPESAKSEWVQREIEFALSNPKYKNRLLPVIVKPTKSYPWILESFPIIRPSKNLAETSRRIATALKKAG